MSGWRGIYTIGIHSHDKDDALKYREENAIRSRTGDRLPSADGRGGGVALTCVS